MKKKWVIILGILIIFIAISITLFIKLNKIEITLNGENELKVEALTKYEEPGITIKKGFKKVKEDKYKITTKNEVDINKIGIYDVQYNIEFENKNYNLNRIVNVVDTIKPEININIETIERDYCTKNNLNELQYTAIDNYDKDITDKITTEEVDDKLILKVTDSSNNEEKKEIPIKYTEKPEDKFFKNGNDIVYIALNNPYNEEGAQLTDGCGNPKEADIKISGEVNTSQVGDYIVKYELEGYEPLTRTVNVYEIHYDPKTIYLTFDDGPGAYTSSILETLNRHNVKATFFVTNQFPAYQHLIADEFNSGHTVAVHTYSHNYNVYSSVDSYINDFNQMNELIKNYTGSYSTQFRFPGGSSNTISRNYSIGVVRQIADEMTRRGYIYYDWNVDSTDAAGSWTDAVYNNVVNGTNNCTSCVVLMHDIKQPTAESLDRIITTLKQRGYTFERLTPGSPTSHHGINN